jgi:RNA polymerase sigma-70 factor (ECF subfamily)
MSDDWQVIQQILAGERESFRVLVQRYQGPLFGLIHNLAPNRTDAEDLAQEVFLTAYERLSSFDPAQARFSTWLLTIARNKCLNALKKKRPVLREDLPAPLDWRTPEANLAEAELFRQLDWALAALPLEQRTAFVLVELHDLSYEETAAIEGVSLGTVKSRISRAKEKLRDLYRSPQGRRGE